MVKKKSFKKSAGRKQLPTDKKRKRYYYYLNDQEESLLRQRMSTSPYNQLSAFVRAILLEKTTSVGHVDPVAFINDVGKLSFEVGKLGTNINQLSKHANEMAINGIIDKDMASAIEERISTYTSLQKEITLKLKELLT